MFLGAIFLPLVGSILVGLFGRSLGRAGVGPLTIFCLVGSFGLTLIQYCLLEDQSTVLYIPIYQWLSVAHFTVEVELVFDTLTFVMVNIVLIISIIVHFYSIHYLAADPHTPRFFCFLSLFTFFMLILVSSENLIQLFFGWEGVGICSYLLISFWHTRVQALKSGLKAIFVNKIGDLAFLAASAAIYHCLGTTTFSVIFPCLPYCPTLFNSIYNDFRVIDLVAILFLVAAIGKSAQVGLHVWLPDAMEGPTPVSALLHAATMVTAGIFLLLRLNPLFSLSPLALSLTLLVGGLTTLLAGSIGFVQNDIKRVIAFSTCSQIGYMFVAFGLTQYSLSLFHLFNHAFFKALLFLGAGSIIHALKDEQDIRRMGGLSRLLPLTFTFFVVATFSLAGFPWLSGFFSKDLILETLITMKDINYYTSFTTGVLLFSTFLTALYGIRLIAIVFFNRPNFYRNALSLIKEPSWRVQIPLAGLTILSVSSGYIFSDIFIGLGNDSVNAGVLPPIGQTDIESLPLYQKGMPLLLTFSGITLTMLFLVYRPFAFFPLPRFLYSAICFLNHRWFFDKIYNTAVLRFTRACFYYFYSFSDKGLIEQVGPFGVSKNLTSVAWCFRNLQPGHISVYLMIYGTSFFLICVVVSFASWL